MLRGETGDKRASSKKKNDINIAVLKPKISCL